MQTNDATSNTLTSRPTVSVVIPCYNRGKYLPDAVESVLEQEGDFELVEILVVDDHSDDCLTIEVLDELAKDPLVRVMHNDGPRGPSAPRNVGIAAAHGDWIAFLDSDDFWLPGSLEARTNVIMLHPECRWVGGDIRKWPQTGRRHDEGLFWTGRKSGPILKSRVSGAGEAICLHRPVKEFIQTNLTSTIATMVRRDLLLDVGGFDETLRQSNDVDLWIRLALRADLWFVPQVLAVYRQHEANLSRPSGPPKAWALCSMKTLLRRPEFRPYRAHLRRRIAHFQRKQARHHRLRGNVLAAAWAATRSVWNSLVVPRSWRQIGSVISGSRGTKNGRLGSSMAASEITHD